MSQIWRKGIGKSRRWEGGGEGRRPGCMDTPSACKVSTWWAGMWMVGLSHHYRERGFRGEDSQPKCIEVKAAILSGIKDTHIEGKADVSTANISKMKAIKPEKENIFFLIFWWIVFFIFRSYFLSFICGFCVNLVTFKYLTVVLNGFFFFEYWYSLVFRISNVKFKKINQCTANR